MIKRLRALLVGVTEYQRSAVKLSKAPPTKVSLVRPWSALDVDTMLGLIEAENGRRFADAEVWCLVDGEDTRYRPIVDEGLRWLCEGADDNDQLLFYFSGHAMLVRRKQQRGWDEVLCPSDTDWAHRGITDTDLMRWATPALAAGACLEVVLETCSAANFFDGSVQTPVVSPPKLPSEPIMRFGCFFGSGDFPAGRGAVWSASDIQQHSYAAPLPVCSDGPIQGLFTHFFCERFAERTRHELLQAVTRDLDTYRKRHNHIACCGREPMARQTPTLYAKTAAATAGPAKGGLALSGDCAPGIKAMPAFQKPAACEPPLSARPSGGRPIRPLAPEAVLVRPSVSGKKPLRPGKLRSGRARRARS